MQREGAQIITSFLVGYISNSELHSVKALQKKHFKLPTEVSAEIESNWLTGANLCVLNVLVHIDWSALLSIENVSTKNWNSDKIK